MAAAAPERPMTRTSSMYIAETVKGSHSFEATMKRGTGVVGRCLSSGTFAVGGHDWRIRFYLRGIGAADKAHTAIFLDLVSDGVDNVEVQVIYDFRLLNHATGVFSSVLSNSSINPPRPSKGPWGNDFMKRSSMGQSYQKDGCIVIECDVTVVRQSLVEETVEVQVPPSNLLDGLGKLLESEEGADVRFEVKGEVFHAHKIILVARSPVLKELLCESLRDDNETKSITVEDVEPSVFKALLYFIYTDSLPAMDDDLDGVKNEEMIWCLLVAAEKYSMERMKLMCVDILCKRLDDKSVIGTLTLADKHYCSEVRDACIEFMKRECPAGYIDMLEKEVIGLARPRMIRPF